jgi:hypothetical protein
VERVHKEMGYSLQANVKIREGGTHKDCDSQFRYINDLAKEIMKCRVPLISLYQLMQRKRASRRFQESREKVAPQRFSRKGNCV